MKTNFKLFSIDAWNFNKNLFLLFQTNTGFLLIFRLEQDIKSETGINLYEYRQNKSAHSENSDGIPALRLCLKASIQYSSTITRWVLFSFVLSKYYNDFYKIGELKILNNHLAIFLSVYHVSMMISWYQQAMENWN